MAKEKLVKPNSCEKFDQPQSGEFPTVKLQTNEDAILVLSICPAPESQGRIVVAHFSQGAQFSQLFTEALTNIRGMSGFIDIQIIHGPTPKELQENKAVTNIKRLFTDDTFTKLISVLSWRDLNTKKAIPISSEAIIKFENGVISISSVAVPDVKSKQDAGKNPEKTSFWKIFTSNKNPTTAADTTVPKSPRPPSPSRQS